MKQELLTAIAVVMGASTVRLWVLWRKAVIEISQLRKQADNDRIWSTIISQELDRSHKLVTSVYEGQIGLNEEYLRVLEHLEKMRVEVATGAYEIWKLEEKCKEQEEEIESLKNTGLRKIKSVRPN